MAALTTTSLASAVLHCDLAVPHDRNVSGSPVHARFKMLRAIGSLSSSAHSVTQTQEGFSCRIVRRRRHGVVVARSQRVSDVEAPQVESAEAENLVHKVVIVGGGIAGLSAAVALHRVGVKVLVLERAPSIRASGASLFLWGNAWRALDYLGVADVLRETHVQVDEMDLYDRSGKKLLRKLKFRECAGGPHEVRGVERKALVEALATELPPGTLQLNSRVCAISKEAGDGLTKVELEDGSVISTKVLVGCDGANSVVAKWMGFPPARFVGQIGIRGVAEYSEGHDFGISGLQFLGNGARCGIFPFSASKVYWFYAFNSSSPGPKVTDRNLVKAEVLQAMRDGRWSDRMTELVNKTPIKNLSRAAIGDRWNIPRVTPALSCEGVALGGDAMHPMTPNLGQGGCTAIEDAIVLAQTLGVVISEEGDTESLRKALEMYAELRQQRTLPLTVRSFIIGYLLSIDFPPVLYIRDNFAIPKLVGPASFLSHTLFDVGRLPTSKVRAQ